MQQNECNPVGILRKLQSLDNDYAVRVKLIKQLNDHILHYKLIENILLILLDTMIILSLIKIIDHIYTIDSCIY